MSAAMLTCSDTAEARFFGGSLDETLRALSTLGVGECLVCGAVVEVSRDGRVSCAACGSVLGAPARKEDQLAIV